MTTHAQGCLVCGQDLEYSSAPVLRFCHYCGSSQETNAACAASHYVRDRCHSAQANDLIEKVCIAEERSPGSRPAGQEDRKPVSLAMRPMSHPAISLITEATPLSGEEWRLSNRLTARTPAVIAEHGGPRRCKTDTMLALQEAVAVLGEELGVQLPVADKVRCSFFHRNRECLRQGCPYFPSAVS